MRWSDSTHGKRRRSYEIGLNLGKKSAETIWGYLWGVSDVYDFKLLIYKAM
jgi:hypothetical protein